VPAEPVIDAAAAEEEAEYQRRLEEQMAAMGSDDDDSEDEEAKAIEESRRRRQAIKEKHEADAKAAAAANGNAASNGVAAGSGTDANGSSDDGDLGRKDGYMTGDESSDNEDATKAGDVDEAQMLKEDEEHMAKKLGSPRNQDTTYDMFGDDADIADAKTRALDRNAGNNALDNDNWDDADGYYKFQMGEKMQDRYEVFEVTGKGVFSNVLRARDIDRENKEVAIKIIRNNDMMKKCGDKELEILQLIAREHGADKHNIVQLHEHFWMHGHLCLVFEALAMNLREVIKKFGNNRGINVGAVHKFAKQMFVALRHMKACKVIHADIKPDNILVNDRHNQIKICDFGSASYIEECDITPYLVSRWYRAPEITLCIKYDYGIDMWSIATCLYELYTGKVMFSGNTNNDMLRRFMEIKGKFPNKLLKRSISKCIELGRPVDFTDDFKFMRVVVDKVTKKQSIKVITIDEKPEKDLLKLCMPHKIKNPDEAKMVKDLVDLLHHCLALSNDQRFTPEQALKHSFVKTQIH
jgi:serine/threonine-protein kinase PRP4